MIPLKIMFCVIAALFAGVTVISVQRRDATATINCAYNRPLAHRDGVGVIYADLRRWLCADVQSMSALPPEADMGQFGCDVCFVPKADRTTIQLCRCRAA